MVKARDVLVVETVSIAEKQQVPCQQIARRQFANNRNALMLFRMQRIDTIGADADGKGRHSNAQAGAFLCGALVREDLSRPKNPLISLEDLPSPNWHASCIGENIDRH